MLRSLSACLAACAFFATPLFAQSGGFEVCNSGDVDMQWAKLETATTPPRRVGLFELKANTCERLVTSVPAHLAFFVTDDDGQQYNPKLDVQIGRGGLVEARSSDDISQFCVDPTARTTENMAGASGSACAPDERMAVVTFSAKKTISSLVRVTIRPRIPISAPVWFDRASYIEKLNEKAANSFDAAALLFPDDIGGTLELDNRTRDILPAAFADAGDPATPDELMSGGQTYTKAELIGMYGAIVRNDVTTAARRGSATAVLPFIFQLDDEEQILFYLSADTGQLFYQILPDAGVETTPVFDEMAKTFRFESIGVTEYIRRQGMGAFPVAQVEEYIASFK